MCLEVGEAVRDHVVANVTLEFDDEAVVAQTSLGGAALELGQVDVACGETSQDSIERSRAVGILEADDRGPVVARGCRDGVSTDENEPGRIVGVVLDVCLLYTSRCV